MILHPKQSPAPAPPRPSAPLTALLSASASSRRAAPPPAVESAEETVFMAMEATAKVPLAWLAVVNGPGAKRGKVITLSAETTVGRTQGNLLLAGDRGVSSQHLRIRLEPKQNSAAGELVFVAYDQATTNGTYIGPWESYREESARVFAANSTTAISCCSARRRWYSSRSTNNGTRAG